MNSLLPRTDQVATNGASRRRRIRIPVGWLSVLVFVATLYMTILLLYMAVVTSTLAATKQNREGAPHAPKIEEETMTEPRNQSYTPITKIADDEEDLHRVLYVVTSSGTSLGKDKKDRWEHMVVPVLQQNIASYFDTDHIEASSKTKYRVDLYIITAYTPTLEQKDMLRTSLPDSVGIQYWSDAFPYTYSCNEFVFEEGHPIASNYLDCAHWTGEGKHVGKMRRAEDRPDQKPEVRLREATAQLARQHRYVIKDKMPYYDFFVNIEDDMMYTKKHVETHRRLAVKINALKADAEDRKKTNQKEYDADPWNAPLGYEDLRRMQAGFLRVEVLSSDEQPCIDEAKKERLGVDSISINAIDPTKCCIVDQNAKQSFTTNISPKHNDLVIWETRLQGFRLRPWIPLQVKDHPQAHQNTSWFATSAVSGQSDFPAYWTSHQITDSFDAQPRARRSKNFVKADHSSAGWLIAQQGGWMASTGEMLNYHTELCKTDFLPPFSPGKVARDGLHRLSVEYFSGGIQLWGTKSCAIQRVYEMDSASDFSNHLVYHTSNNKQCVFKRFSNVTSSIRPYIDKLREHRLKERNTFTHLRALFGNEPKFVDLYKQFRDKDRRLVRAQQLWTHLSEVKDGIVREFDEGLQ